MFLTPKQREMLDFIRSFTADHGYAPSTGELQARFGLGSPATVHKHLKNLEARGALRREPRRSRALEVVDQEPRVAAVEVPLRGFVAAGRPMEAIEQPDTIAIPEHFLGRSRTYVLKVKGDSMIEDCIQDGDYVVVEERRHATNGEMVIACLGGADVTLKRFYREPGRIRLQPANSRYQPTYVAEDELEICGVVIGVMRRY